MPLPLVAIGVGAAARFLAKQAATALAKRAAAAAARKASEEAAKKAVAEALKRQVAEAAVKEAAKKAAQESLKKGAPKAGAKGPGNTAGKHKAKKGRRKKDPCKHDRDKQKRKYVVYKADEFDKSGKKIGTYVGRTSGKPTESSRQILARRLSGHHRNVFNLDALFETNSYAAARGAEQLLRNKYSTVNQINPIGPKNPRISDYVDCAKLKGA